MRVTSPSHRDRVRIGRGRRAALCAVLYVAQAGLGCGRPAVLGYLAPAGGDDRRAELGLVHASVSAALRAEYRDQAARTPPPVALVPADGGELELLALAASVRIEGPLAHTELRLTFHNPEPRVREGRFSIELPPDAAVGRFGMKVGEAWREARVVTRERGREVYEVFLHRGVDPALLEQDLGNRFSARVFPIAAESDKELVIAYDHRVSAARPYVLALAGLPAIRALSVEIDQDGERRTIRGGGGLPEDVVVPIDGGSEAVAGGDVFVARIEPVAALADHEAEPAARGPALDRVLVLVDTSASRAPVMARQVELVRGLVAALPPDAEVAIAAFDHGVAEVYRGPVRGAGAAAAALYERGALGASDLGAALGRAVASGMARVVIVGDGAPTLGEHEPARLAAIVRGSPIARIDAIQVGTALDRDTLAAVVAAGREPGAILDGRDPAHAARQLAVALPAEEPIRVDGAAASFPATTRGLAPGEPIWVAGRRSGGRAGDGPLVVRIGARTVELSPQPADPSRVRRAAARAELAALTERLQQATAPDARAALGAQIEALALEHRLPSARTSLLVLESDADERLMLTAAERGEAPVGARGGAPAAVRGGAPIAAHDAAPVAADGGAPIVVHGASRAPTIAAHSTRTGVTLDADYSRRIPIRRTFDSVLGAAAGQQRDSYGESIMIISGSTSIENYYYVDSVRSSVHGPETGISPLSLGVLADRLRSSAAPFGMPERFDEPRPSEPPPPYTGELAAVMAALARGDRDAALGRAIRWQLASPGDVAAILALGESLEARGAGSAAARAYGSLIDLFPNRAELLRTAGERLDRIAATVPAARALAIDAYRRALRERSDHVTTYRLLAFALLRAGRGGEAIDVLGDGLARATRPSVTELLAGDAGVIAAHLVARDPSKRRALALRMRRGIADRPSLRIVLSWETDANDVNLHVRDRAGGHASFIRPRLPSGGELLENLTSGYGPEAFVVEEPTSFPYRIAAHYYRRGPMGLGLGTVQVIRHDGAGGVTVEDRPFVIQNDYAMIDLGEVRQ